MGTKIKYLGPRIGSHIAQSFFAIKGATRRDRRFYGKNWFSRLLAETPRVSLMPRAKTVIFQQNPLRKALNLRVNRLLTTLNKKTVSDETRERLRGSPMLLNPVWECGRQQREVLSWSYVLYWS